MRGNFFGGAFFGGGFFGRIGSGVGKGKKKPTLRVNLKDYDQRQDLGEYLKQELRTRHPELYDLEKKTPFDLIRERDERRRLKVIARREARMRREADELAILQQDEEKRRLSANNQLLIMLLTSDT